MFRLHKLSISQSTLGWNEFHCGQIRSVDGGPIKLTMCCCVIDLVTRLFQIFIATYWGLREYMSSQAFSFPVTTSLSNLEGIHDFSHFIQLCNHAQLRPTMALYNTPYSHSPSIHVIHCSAFTTLNCLLAPSKPEFQLRMKSRVTFPFSMLATHDFWSQLLLIHHCSWPPLDNSPDIVRAGDGDVELHNHSGSIVIILFDM